MEVIWEIVFSTGYSLLCYKILTTMVLICFLFCIVHVLYFLIEQKNRNSRIISDERNKRKLLEIQVQHMNQELVDCQKMAEIGSWEWQVGDSFIHYTEEYRRIFGFKKVDIRLTDVCSLICIEDVELFKDAIEKLMVEVYPIIIEFRIVNCEGVFKILKAHLKMICDAEGIPLRLCGIVQDITKIKQTEDLLMMKAIQLERSKKDLQQFVTVASHDLNEPLRKLQTYSGLLKNECFSTITERGKNYITTIKSSACRLNNLIEDLTIFSKIGLRKEVFEEVDLTMIVDSVAKDIYFEYGSAVKIIFDRLPVLQVIAEQIKLLFQQVIQNAIKFKKEGDIPEIQISYEIISGKNLLPFEKTELKYGSVFCMNYCQIFIKDNGIGFEEKYSNKIFSIFQQLHNKGKYSGTGIGLAICKKIMDNHNGFITAKSTLNSGATFIITLPYNRFTSLLN
jgi:PAS domain S-box-containing protein